MSSRARSVVTAAVHGGAICAPLAEIKPCMLHACPSDCELTEWGGWEVCTATCGGGTQERKRAVTKAATAGGYECGHLVESQACNRHACPANCVVSAFGAWGICSQTCGGGVQTHTRSITTAVAHGGKACPELAESRLCNIALCAVDCEESPWADWGSCSVSCGDEGIAIRSRSISREQAHGGKACGHLSETKTCSRGACPVHCQVSSYSGWTDCTLTCGTGAHSRSRSVVRHATYGGYTCPELVETRHCNEAPCPQDCVVGPWQSWSSCNKSCGGGTKRRTRTLAEPALDGGACLPLEEIDGCNVFACPIDCKLTSWGAWGACSAKCDGGLQTRKRQIAQLPEAGGKACDQLQQSQNCNQRICDLADQQTCSHVTCEYKPHTLEHANEVMNFPENGIKEHAGIDGRGRSKYWHVGVKHDKSEQNGGRHYCHNVGQHMPRAGGAPWNEKREGQSCVCVCFGSAVNTMHGATAPAVRGYQTDPVGVSRRRRYGSTWGTGYDKENRTYKYRR